MEKRIELEKRGKAPDQIKELNLDNCRSTSIVGLTDEFVNLEILSLINVGLTSLKGFPKLPNLKRIIHSGRRFDDFVGWDAVIVRTEKENLKNKTSPDDDSIPSDKVIETSTTMYNLTTRCYNEISNVVFFRLDPRGNLQFIIILAIQIADSSFPAFGITQRERLKLELSDNRISNGLNLLHTSPKITHLNLSGNKIKDLETLDPLKELKNLRNLDLFNNDTTNVENYREKVFKLIPSLKYLDGYDTEDKEAESDEEWEDEEEDGLEAVYKDNIEDDSEEYEGEEEEDDEEEEDEEDEEDDDEEDGEEESTPRGKKRKLEDGGKEDGESKKSNSSTVE